MMILTTKSLFEWAPQWRLNLRQQVHNWLFCFDRDTVLRALDVGKFEDFCRRHGHNNYIRNPKWADKTVPLGAMHKMRLQIRAFTQAEKLVSANWLIDNGYNLPEPLEFKDGVLIGAEYNQ